MWTLQYFSALSAFGFLTFFIPYSLPACTSHNKIEYSVQLLNETASKNTTSTDCFENSIKPYKIVLRKWLTISRILLENETILVGPLRYSYDDKVWFSYDGAVAASFDKAVGLTTPLYARYLQLTLGSTTGHSKCTSLSIYACDNEATPSISLTTTAPQVVMSDSVDVVCLIVSQPRPDVSWKTSNAYTLTSQYIVNQFATTTTGTQRSTLSLSKRTLARGGFTCQQNVPPCTIITCSTNYPGSNVTKSVSVNLDILPSPQRNFSTLLVTHHSATITWQRPLHDVIMNYTRYRVVVSSLLGPPSVTYILAKNKGVSDTMFYTLPNLVPCTFYEIELLTNNYFGESSGVKTSFTTPVGLINISAHASVLNSSSVVANWTTSSVARTLNRNCIFLKATQFAIQFNCLYGFSNLSLCASLKTAYRNGSEANAIIGNLNPATVYVLRIIALTQWPSLNITSTALRFTTSEAVPSGGPANARVRALNATAVELRWSGVADEKSHGEVTRYVITMLREDDTAFKRNVTFNKETSIAKFFGLKACTVYTFRLRGCTKIGCGPASVAKVRTADVINATYEYNVTFSAVTPNNITAHVRLDQLSSHQCLIGYDVRYRRKNQTAWSKVTRSFLQRTASIHGLDSFQVYEFTTRLVGHNSSSDWSDSIQSRTPEGIPGPINNLQIQSRSNSRAAVSWSAPMLPRGVVQGYFVVIQGKRSYNHNFTYDMQRYVNGSQATSIIINTAFPATVYSVCVKAINKKYTADCQTISIITAAKPPLQPKQPTVLESTIIHSNVRITFQPITDDSNGPITMYQVIVLIRRQSNDRLPGDFTSKLRSYNSAVANSLPFYLAAELNGSSSGFLVGDGSVKGGLLNAPLDRSLNYTVFFRTVSTWINRTTYSTLSFVDINRYPIETRPVSLPAKQPATTIALKLPLFNRHVKYIRVIVQKVNRSATHFTHLSNHYDDDGSLTVYTVAKDNGFRRPYITAELGISVIDNTDQFVVGDGKVTSRGRNYNKRDIATRRSVTAQYLNGPLLPKSLYVVAFRAYHSDLVYFSSNWSVPIRTSPLPSTTIGSNSNATRVGIVFLYIIIALIIFILLVCIVLYYVKRKKTLKARNHTFSTMELISNINGAGIGIGDGDNLNFTDDVFEATGSKTGFEYPIDFFHPPVPIMQFVDYVAEMRERDCCFEDEFNELDEHRITNGIVGGDSELTLVAKQNARNGDKASLPGDSFRVVLHNRKSNQSNYVNASFVDNYTKWQRAYIASQMPLQAGNDFNEFWDMLWQNEVRTVLVFSHPLDADKVEDTPRWWPCSSSVTHYGDVMVKPDRANKAACIGRVDGGCSTFGFTIHVAKCQERSIRLFQLKTWPERGVPESIDEILRFRDQVNQWHAGKDGPMVVQCRNGCGRTGTYIALDSILNNLNQSVDDMKSSVQQHRTVDIFNFVRYLRTRRANMVENDKQYEFIHDAILEVLTKVHVDIEICKDNAHSVLAGLARIDSFTGCTGFTKLFKHLNNRIPSVSVNNLEACKAINDYKNRYPDKVPRDAYRVRLPVLGATRADVCDYINASFVTINDECRFITTQAPFGITVNDFWTMVSFSNAEVIVVLNEADVHFSPYWPGAESVTSTYGNFKVSLELECTPYPSIFRRDFMFSELRRPDVQRELSQFHVRDWEDHGIPSNRSAVLALCKHLASNFMTRNKAPIIVQCSDGFGRSGTFCACLQVVKQLMTKGNAHIPDLVRGLRKRNTSYIETEAQFKFIFQLARDFLASKSNSSTQGEPMTK
eukprot:gene7509-8342_t